MAALIAFSLGSLDGYTADVRGNFDFAAPDEEVHRFVNELERSVGTCLLGRRMYEVMSVWDSPELLAGPEGPGALPEVVQEYAAIWQAAEKVVYSRTLSTPAGPRTRFERRFDPAAVQQLKREAERDISVGGPTLASHAFRAGLVDELRVIVAPTLVGGGLHLFPESVRQPLELLDERRFGNGMVYLRYRVAH